jgi:enamine deaminase RidA (YjgF/YER057c/UK114 family)
MLHRSAVVAAFAIVTLVGSAAAQGIERGWEPIISESQSRSYEAFRYAPMVRIGETLIARGVIGVGGGDNSAGAQFRRAFERMIAILEDHGLTLADVAEMTTYHVNLGELGQEFMTIRSEFLPEPPYPAWTAIGVERLWMEQALIEIRFTAALRPE